MENASKALIIAGAILLAIVIISLGLIVVNNTRNTVDTANLNEQEIQAFNAKFSSYEGKDIAGSRVKSLLQTVIAVNSTKEDQNDKVGIYSIKKGTTGSLLAKGSTTAPEKNDNNISSVSQSVTTKGKYDITLSYGNKSLVSYITIQEK